MVDKIETHVCFTPIDQHIFRIINIYSMVAANNMLHNK